MASGLLADCMHEHVFIKYILRTRIPMLIDLWLNMIEYDTMMGNFPCPTTPNNRATATLHT